MISTKKLIYKIVERFDKAPHFDTYINLNELFTWGGSGNHYGILEYTCPSDGYISCLETLSFSGSLDAVIDREQYYGMNFNVTPPVKSYNHFTYVRKGMVLKANAYAPTESQRTEFGLQFHPLV